MLPLMSPVRRIVRRILRHRRPIILMYHRVARLAHDPWRLAVSPEHFAAQIECLARARRVVPLSTLAQALMNGDAPRGFAAITFDDGYIDVLAEAKPILERFDCPATAFLATGAIGSGREFWWDVLVRIIFETPLLPQTLAIEISGRLYQWRLIGGPVDTNAAENGRPQLLSRSELHNKLWHLLRMLDPAEKERQIEYLLVWANVDRKARRTDIAMSSTEVRQLANGLVDIGAHTVTHPSLPALSANDRRAEIEGSRKACEELAGASVTSFAYPFGDLDTDSVAAVRDAGFTIACCTDSGVVTPRSLPLRLPRVDIGNWSGSEFERRLSMNFGVL
jgi:peptidoglycan/xylan/chitin deacetylase (PgdA/CDA1 family)